MFIFAAASVFIAGRGNAIAMLIVITWFIPVIIYNMVKTCAGVKKFDKPSETIDYGILTFIWTMTLVITGISHCLAAF